MRFLNVVAAALAVTQGAFAVDIQKSIIMSFPQGTPDDVVNRAKEEVRKAGGTITHEYKLLKYEASLFLLLAHHSLSGLYTNKRECTFLQLLKPRGLLIWGMVC